MIIAVVSPPGAGKTYWIRQQIAQTNKPVGYFSPQTDSLPIDATYLQSEYPQLKLYQTGEEAELNKTITYLEIPWYLDLAGIEPLLQTLNPHRVAIIPNDADSTELKTWADEIIPGNKITKPTKALQIHRGVLTGEILDFDSLATFWLELTQGAYGEVVRAKGIFDLVDGQIYYVEQIRSLDIPTVQGCWDEDIVEGLNACECSYPSLLAEKRGKIAHEWTNKHVNPEFREYLAQLPPT